MTKCSLAALAAIACALGGAQAATFKYTASRAGADNFRTVYTGNGVNAAVMVCTIDRGVNVHVYAGGQLTPASIPATGECTVVVGDRVVVLPYVVQHNQATVNVTILGVAGVHDAAP